GQQHPRARARLRLRPPLWPDPTADALLHHLDPLPRLPARPRNPGLAWHQGCLDQRHRFRDDGLQHLLHQHGGLRPALLRWPELKPLIKNTLRVSRCLVTAQTTHQTAAPHRRSPHVLVPVGAGFIRSNLVHRTLTTRPGVHVHVVDAMAYAANPLNLRSTDGTPLEQAYPGRFRFTQLDRADREAVLALVDEVAAEVPDADALAIV